MKNILPLGPIAELISATGKKIPLKEASFPAGTLAMCAGNWYCLPHDAELVKAYNWYEFTNPTKGNAKNLLDSETAEYIQNIQNQPKSIISDSNPLSKEYEEFDDVY